MNLRSHNDAPLDTVQSHLRIAARIVDDLHDTVKAQHRKLLVALEPLNLHTLIHESIEGFRNDLAESKLTLMLDLAAPSHKVDGDSGGLLQILWTLQRNAIKFTPRGGIIHINTFNEDAPENGGGCFVALEISDSGIGLEGGDLERIFLPFRQAAQPAPAPRQLAWGLVWL